VYTFGLLFLYLIALTLRLLPAFLLVCSFVVLAFSAHREAAVKGPHS